MEFIHLPKKQPIASNLDDVSLNKMSANTKSPVALAREVLMIEARAVESLADRLDDSFNHAVDLILQCQGRIVVSGMGKSGHIASKIAATLASTGTPAFFMHPAEASHGDLGMITAGDVVIGLSNSGESEELLAIVPLLKRMGAKLISITGNTRSSLAQLADVHLDAHVEQEACPLGLAPTASTTAMLALGDALAVTALDLRGFSAEDFARSHPGGSLGRKLLLRVQDLMRQGSSIPQVTQEANVMQALLEISNKGLGMTAIVDAQQKAIGVFTDGDLRRSLEAGVDVKNTRIVDVMRTNPQTILPTQLAVDAVSLMEERKVNALLVSDAQGRLVGALNMHDLLLAKVV
jgi:arabinose-5-phosphate isomerase